MENADLKKLVFLVVDDDGQVRHILTEYLKSFGFEHVLQAKDGMSALKIVQNHQQPIDFIISDWEMPQVDGLTLLKAVRNDSHRDNVKFVMVSSQGSRERMKITKAARSRVDAYVVKPFRAKVLQEKIQTLLNGEIDSSVAEFEGILSEVPSNQQIAAKKHGKVVVEKETQDHGKVLLDKDQKGAGIISNLKRLAVTGPKKIKVSTEAVKVAHAEAEAVDEFMDKVFGDEKVGEGNQSPPENYDLNKMSIAMVVSLAKAYIKAKLTDKAIRLCVDAQFIYATSTDILYQLALAYQEKGEASSAMAQLKKIIKIDPYHTEAQTLLADIDMATKKTG